MNSLISIQQIYAEDPLWQVKPQLVFKDVYFHFLTTELIFFVTNIFYSFLDWLSQKLTMSLHGYFYGHNLSFTKKSVWTQYLNQYDINCILKVKPRTDREKPNYGRLMFCDTLYNCDTNKFYFDRCLQSVCQTKISICKQHCAMGVRRRRLFSGVSKCQSMTAEYCTVH